MKQFSKQFILNKMKASKQNFTSKSYKVFLCVLSIVCVVILSNSVYAQKKEAAEKKVPDKLLAGKIYTIELTAQGGKKVADPEKDELSFKSDKFTSNLMKTNEQFMAAPYTAAIDSSNTESKVITFEVESKNSGDEILKWTGTVTGEEIEGTAVWTSKKGKIKKEYKFTGTLKGKKKK